jgi:hypothetical protein
MMYGMFGSKIHTFLNSAIMELNRKVVKAEGRKIQKLLPKIGLPPPS